MRTSMPMAFWALLTTIVATGCSGSGSGGGSPIVNPDDSTSSVTLTGGSSVTANGTASAQLSITLRLSDGTVLASTPVAVSSSDSTDTLDPATGNTDANGVFDTEITGTVAGTKTLTITANPGSTSPLTLSTQPTVTLVAGPPSASQSTISASPTNVAADGASTTTVTVTVRDAFGNAITGETVQLSSSGSSNTFAQPVATGSGGSTTGTLASPTDETKIVSATVDPSGAAIALIDTASVTFIAPPRVNDPARFRDTNRNGACDAGDELALGFDEVITVLGMSPSYVELPVTGDDLGTGATISSLPVASEITVSLGTSPTLTVRSHYQTSATSANDPSGVRLSASTPTGVITSVINSFTADTSMPPVDIAPEFVTTNQVLGVASSRAVALGDIDADGDIDAIFGNRGSANVVYTNDGSATLTSAQSLGTATTVDLALGDIDADGDVDLVTANDGESSRVWTNDGSGTFTDSGQSLGTVDARCLAIGDVDADGDLDVVLGIDGAADQVWLNTAGTFTNSGQSLETDDTAAVLLADLDDDGDLDLLCGTGASQGNSLWSNDGSGTFSDSGQSLGTSDALSLAAGDIDSDGDLDVAIGTQDAINQIFTNDGSGTFTDSGASHGNSSTHGLALVDYDGDHDLDLITGDALSLPSASPSSVLLNDGTGTFSDSGQTLGFLTDVRDLAIADMDQDGDWDLVHAVNAWSNQVWTGSLSGVFGNTTLTAGAATAQLNTSDCDPVDVDDDGDVDVFLSDSVTASVLYTNDGTGSFSLSAQSFPTIYSSAFGDVDRDGDLDLVAATSASGIVIRLNNGSGTLVDSGQSHGSSTTWVELGDVDNDGDLDAVFIDGGDVKVFTNNGSGGFSDSGQTLVSATLEGVTLGDFDRDGDLDMAVAVWTAGNVIYTNNGSGVFSDSGQSLGTSATTGLLAGDLDGDGDLDLYETVTGGGSNRIWRNSGGTFNDAGESIGNANSRGGALLDFDADGDLDLLDPVGGTAAPFLYLNDGSMAFTASTETITLASHAAPLDADGDGDLDVFVGVTTGAQLYRNQ